MESGPALILRTLDRHLTGPGHVRLFGGAPPEYEEIFTAAKPKVLDLLARSA